MKITPIIAAAMVCAGLAVAGGPPIYIDLDGNWQQLQSLRDLGIQQGADAELRVRVKTDGAWLTLTGLTARWEARANMTTSAAYLAASDLTTNAAHYIRIPLTASQTGTATTNWIYSVVIIDGLKEYPVGTGTYSVAASGFAGASAVITSQLAATEAYVNTAIGLATGAITAAQGDITAVTVAGGLLSGGTNAGPAVITLTTAAVVSAVQVITNGFGTGDVEAWTAGAGLTNTGTAANPTGALSASSQASLALADTAVQPATLSASGALWVAQSTNLSQQAGASAYYPLSGNPSNFLTAGATNQGWVTQTITNGFATILYVDGATNAAVIDATNRVAHVGYLLPGATNQGWVTRAQATSGVVVVESDPQWAIWRTNAAAGSTNAILPSGALVDIGPLLVGSGAESDPNSLHLNGDNAMVALIDAGGYGLKRAFALYGYATVGGLLAAADEDGDLTGSGGAYWQINSVTNPPTAAQAGEFYMSSGSNLASRIALAVAGSVKVAVSNAGVYFATPLYGNGAGITNLPHDTGLSGIGGSGTLHLSAGDTNRLAMALTNAAAFDAAGAATSATGGITAAWLASKGAATGSQYYAGTTTYVSNGIAWIGTNAFGGGAGGGIDAATATNIAAAATNGINAAFLASKGAVTNTAADWIILTGETQSSIGDGVWTTLTFTGGTAAATAQLTRNGNVVSNLQDGAVYNVTATYAISDIDAGLNGYWQVQPLVSGGVTLGATPERSYNDSVVEIVYPSISVLFLATNAAAWIGFEAYVADPEDDVDYAVKSMRAVRIK